MKINTKKLLLILMSGAIGLCTTASVVKPKDVVVEQEIDDEQEKDVPNITIVEIPVVRAFENVNIKSLSDSESETIGVLFENEILEIVRELDNNWYEVSFNGQLGYVSGDYVIKDTKYVTKDPFEKVVYFNQDSALYQEANDDIPVSAVAQYEAGFIYGEDNGYYYAQVDDKIGYIKKQHTEQLDDVFVIVDISSQTLNLYRDNQVILTAPVITGKPTTPTNIGFFTVYNITTKRCLIPSYQFIDVMAKFDEDIGFHDAEYHDCIDKKGNSKHHGWRHYDEFGGTSYLTKGSQGCVNMRNEDVTELYKHIYEGTKVLVKR